MNRVPKLPICLFFFSLFGKRLAQNGLCGLKALLVTGLMYYGIKQTTKENYRVDI